MSNPTNIPDTGVKLTTTRPEDSKSADLKADAGRPAAPKPDAGRPFGTEAKAEAADIGKTAAAAADEAKASVSDLADKAKQGFSEATERARGMAENRKAAGADRVKGIAGAINRAADELEDEVPQVARLVRLAAGEAEHLAEEIRRRDLTDLVGVVHDYARRQPAVFLGASALASFALVRFLMTSAEKRTVPAQATTGSARTYPDRPRTVGTTGTRDFSAG
jgi:hypothetical protein